MDKLSQDQAKNDMQSDAGESMDQTRSTYGDEVRVLCSSRAPALSKRAIKSSSIGITVRASRRGSGVVANKSNRPQAAERKSTVVVLEKDSRSRTDLSDELDG